MLTSLSKLVNNLSEGLHNDRSIDCKSFLDYMATKDEKLVFRCFRYKKNYKKDFNKELIQLFANIHDFWNVDLNKFVLLLRKGVYPYEYMDSWERFNETLPDKEAFYSNLNIEDITDVDYKHAKIVFKNLINKNLGDYHDLYVQSDTLLLAHVSEILETCLLTYMNFILPIFICTWISMASLFKEKKVKLELLTDVDMLLMVEKGIRGGECHAIHRYAKANNKYMKDYNKDEEE